MGGIACRRHSSVYLTVIVHYLTVFAITANIELLAIFLLRNIYCRLNILSVHGGEPLKNGTCRYCRWYGDIAAAFRTGHSAPQLTLLPVMPYTLIASKRYHTAANNTYARMIKRINFFVRIKSMRTLIETMPLQLASNGNS